MLGPICSVLLVNLAQDYRWSLDKGEGLVNVEAALFEADRTAFDPDTVYRAFSNSV